MRSFTMRGGLRKRIYLMAAWWRPFVVAAGAGLVFGGAPG